MSPLTLGVLALVLWYLFKNGYFGNLMEEYLPDTMPALARIFPSKNLTGSARNITKTGASLPSLLPFVAQSLTVKKGYKLVLFTQPGQKGDSVTFIDDVQDLSVVPLFKAVGNKIGSYLVDSLKNKGALDYPKYTNADSGGGDIKCFQNGESVATCRALCADDPTCVGYNAVQAGFGGAWGKGGCCYKSNANSLSEPNGVKYIDWYSNIAPAVRPTLSGVSASDMGADNTNPWGANVFVTKDARWIWNSPTAVTSAPGGDVLKFSNNFWNGVAPMAATLHIIVDNAADVYLNGEVIKQNVGGGWNTPDYPKIPMNLVTGNNLIEIIAVNAVTGPAGLKLALVRNSDNAILLKSDNTWKVGSATSALVAIGTNQRMYTKTNIGAPWNYAGDNTCCMTDVTRYNDGFLGSGTDQKLYTKTSLTAPWVYAGDNTCCVKGIKQLKNGTLIGVGTDNKLYTKTSISSPWVYGGDNTCCVTAIEEMPDGTLLGIGLDKKLFKKASLTATWVPVGDNTCCVIDVKANSDGSLIGVGDNNKLYTKANLTAPWVYAGDNTCCVTKIV